MRSDYLELPLYLEHSDEDATVNMYAHLRDKSVLMFTGVNSDPIRYQGWWTISHTFAGREASSHIPAGEVLYFTTLPGEKPQKGDSLPADHEDQEDHETRAVDESRDAVEEDRT